MRTVSGWWCCMATRLQLLGVFLTLMAHGVVLAHDTANAHDVPVVQSAESGGQQASALDAGQQQATANLADTVEGEATALRVAPVTLEDFRKRYCKGVIVQQRLRGPVLVYRVAKEPVVGQSRGCEDAGFRIRNAMSPSAPTPTRSLLVPWEEFAGVDAQDPSGTPAAAVVFLVGCTVSVFTGMGVALSVSEVRGLFVIAGGMAGTFALADKVKRERLRLARTNTDGPLSGLITPRSSGGKP